MSRRLWFAWLLVPCMVMACSGTDNSAEVDSPTPDASDTVAPEDPEDETSPDPGSETYWPSTEAWETVTPEEAGADVNKLNEAIAFAESSNSGGMIVLHKGKIVTERYWQGWDQDTAMTIYSATKSMTALMVGMALDDGSFGDLQQPISDFAPAPKPLVRFFPICILFSAALFSRSCASVLITMKSTPFIPA